MENLFERPQRNHKAQKSKKGDTLQRKAVANYKHRKAKASIRWEE